MCNLSVKKAHESINTATEQLVLSAYNNNNFTLTIKYIKKTKEIYVTFEFLQSIK